MRTVEEVICGRIPSEGYSCFEATRKEAEAQADILIDLIKYIEEVK